MASDKVLHISDSEFETKIVGSATPCLVDFWAPWCGPCKAMAPAFEQAAAKLSPRVILAKINTEEEKALAAQFRIQAIPSLLLFKQGREVDRVAGAMDANALIAWTQERV